MGGKGKGKSKGDKGKGKKSREGKEDGTSGAVADHQREVAAPALKKAPKNAKERQAVTNDIENCTDKPNKTKQKRKIAGNVSDKVTSANAEPPAVAADSEKGPKKKKRKKQA